MSRLPEAYERYHARYMALAALHGWELRRHPRYMEQCVGTMPVATRYGHELCLYGNVEKLGFRLLGGVVPERSEIERRHNYFSGWFTNNRGEYSNKDGDGLCWGVVLLVPGRKRMTRYYAGYRFGCTDETIVDLRQRFEERKPDGGERASDTDAAREAARFADSLAANAAERMRESEEEYEEETQEPMEM